MRLKNEQKFLFDARRTPFKVICIDDEEGMLKTIKVLLSKYGYEVEGYTDHNQGVEMIRSNSYDLLILDYLLVNAKGDEVVKTIRAFNKDLYILLLTGHADCAPPLETIENNNIQAYCEKSSEPTQFMLLVKSAFKSIEIMKEIRTTRDGLKKILRSVPMIYQLQPINIILREIINSVLPIVFANDAFILVDNIDDLENTKESFYQGLGKYDTEIENISNVFSHNMMEYAGLARSSVEVVTSPEGVFVPLTNEYQQSMGILYVESNVGNYDLDLLSIFATQAASSINNAFLHSLVNIKNEELTRTYNVMKTRYEETINTLRLAVDAKDEYTRGHSDRVANYAVSIGKYMSNVSEDELKLLHVGGIFHDIGKIGTSDDILLSDKRLTQDEFTIIKKHPITGANILSALSMFKDVVPLVKYHHEKYDGTGYPEGLKGEEIPFLARILAVADAFDAMTSNRKYRGKLDIDIAIGQLTQGSGIQFDPDIVRIFVSNLKEGRIEMLYCEVLI
jgi:putative nucleotidyltransferase with HDIG domain